MTVRGPLLRFALYGAATVVASTGSPWTWVLGASTGLAGLVLEKRLRSSFDEGVAFFATLGVLSSVSLTGSAIVPNLGCAASFAVSCVAFFWLAESRAPGGLRLALAGALGLGPSVFALVRASWWSLSPDHLLAALFGAHGLLYGAPLLWAGFLGLTAVLAPGALGLLIGTERVDAATRTATWLPFLLPGLAQCFQKARTFAQRRPERALAGAAALLVLWNLLLMEQYRRRLLPSDDTVSFAQVTSNSAGLVSHLVGTPAAWPANWIFAWRNQSPVDQWDAIADRRLFADEKAAAATIEFGDDGSAFAADVPLLLEGFGTRRTCERGWCRDLDGAGRLLLPVNNIGRGDLAIRVRARGQGTLSLSLNRAATPASDLTETLSDLSFVVPARAVRSGLNVLSLSVAGGGRATLDRLTLERDLGTSSAR